MSEGKNGPVLHTSNDILFKNSVVFLGASGSLEEKSRFLIQRIKQNMQCILKHKDILYLLIL